MTSFSGKRLKTTSSKRKDKEPEHCHSRRFLSCKHGKHFKIVQDWRLLMERKARMIPNFAPQFGEQLMGRNWIPCTSQYSSGKGILHQRKECQFALYMEEGTDFDDVESVLCVPRGHFQRNKNGAVFNIRRTDLTPLAKALLLYCALRNMSINVGQVIANEIQVCANTMNNKAPLGHPSLITHLCKIAGVDTSAPPFESPRKSIDEAYYRQYYGAEASAMEEDEDDDDDAFEDVEDNGEEEDTDDSTG
ncbi:hypothetical protein LR48_Vigan07g144000 [Vigna angularis]|uniref:Putative plant transposon protein domain-containing protein n=1 Tax=Phaseolus angularis TaxID=3914 RepID=A0A0L9UYG2_PHAAN|nr:hypothetical protein LR48_Vigan07g144000 [Vigna angularis]